MKENSQPELNQTPKTITLRSKDLSDWLKILVMLGLGFMAYQHLVDRVDVTVTSQQELNAQTTRIERYLSSKDPNYWVETQQQGAGDP